MASSEGAVAEQATGTTPIATRRPSQRSVLRWLMPRIVHALDDQPKRDPALVAQSAFFANEPSFDEPSERCLASMSVRRTSDARNARARNATSA